MHRSSLARPRKPLERRSLLKRGGPIKVRRRSVPAAEKRHIARVAGLPCLVSGEPATVHHVTGYADRAGRSARASRVFHHLRHRPFERGRSALEGDERMSAGQTVILHGTRSVAHRVVDAAPNGSVMTVRAPSRSSEQNSKMWAMLSDISRAKPEGRDMPPDLWKSLFMAACGHRVRFEPGIDGEGVVPLGFRSSRLTKAEMSELIECIAEYGARHNVAWTNEERDGG
jgi:hypothetical protein